MRAVLQRVRTASVSVVSPETEGGPREVARIGPGLVVLVGFSGSESATDLDWLAGKILEARLFGARGEFDKSVVETSGEILVVSQFTLLGRLDKGRRPDFAGAAPATAAQPLYDALLERLHGRFAAVQGGVFGAEMHVALVNEGPATFVLERG